jgi:hypothetical protein
MLLKRRQVVYWTMTVQQNVLRIFGSFAAFSFPFFHSSRFLLSVARRSSLVEWLQKHRRARGLTPRGRLPPHRPTILVTSVRLTVMSTSRRLSLLSREIVRACRDTCIGYSRVGSPLLSL